MVKWETVNTGVRSQVESCVELALVTLNLHVHFFYNAPLQHGLTAVGLDCVRSIQSIYI